MSKAMSVSEAGRKGGNARAKKLTKERRIEIAKQGYQASPLSVKRANSQSNKKITENKVEENPCA
jgi:general stress protein YciG